MTEHPMPTRTVGAWTTQVLRLFVLTYLFLYMFPFPLSELPAIGNLFTYYDKGMEWIIIGIGKHLLQLDAVHKIEMTGSGDTTFDYVKLVATAIISLFISIAILVFISPKSKYDTIDEVVTTYARYYLGLNLLIYGFAKFNEGQFLFPDLVRLEQKMGDASPMGLLWTFMGFSKPYTIFSGLCEVLAGLLLFFRRTSVMGSLMAFAIMTNIAMLNFAYDVPVKLFSTHLALVALFIIFPNVINLIRFFFSIGSLPFILKNLN